MTWPREKLKRDPAKPDLGNTILEREGKPFIESFCKYVELTDSIPESASMLGLTPTAIYDWKARGDVHLEMGKSDTIFAEFALAIKKSRSSFVVRNMMKIHKAAEIEKHWQAAAWTLERRRPEFRLNQEPDYQGGGGNVQVQFIEETALPEKREHYQEPVKPVQKIEPLEDDDD